MLECRAVALAVSDYLDGAVDALSRAAIEDHLARCPRCRVLCDTTRRTVELCRALPQPVVPVDVESRLMAALARRIGSQSVQEPFPVWPSNLKS